ncbi:unnamed protein product, partial [Amoebophrya sp. A120]|eukprot:GSA120T00023148001.1
MEYLAERFQDQGYGDPEMRQHLKTPPIVDPTNPVYRTLWPRGEIRDPNLPTNLEFPIDRREAANENFDRTYFIRQTDPISPVPAIPLRDYHDPWQSLCVRHYPEKPTKTPEKATRAEIKAAQDLQSVRIEDQRVDELFEALQRSALDTLSYGSKYTSGEQLDALRDAIGVLRKERNPEIEKILWRYEDLLTNAELQKAIVVDFDWAAMLETLTQRADELARGKKDRKLTDQTIAMLCLRVCQTAEHALTALRTGTPGGLEGMPPSETVFSSLEKQKIMEHSRIILDHIDRVSPTEVAPRDPRIDLYLIGLLGLMIENWVDSEEKKEKALADQANLPPHLATSPGSTSGNKQNKHDGKSTASSSSSRPKTTAADLEKRKAATSTKYMLFLMDLLETRAEQQEHLTVFAILKVLRFLTKRKEPCVRLVNKGRLAWRITALRDRYKEAPPELGKANYDAVKIEKKAVKVPNYMLPEAIRHLPGGKPVSTSPLDSVRPPGETSEQKPKKEKKSLKTAQVDMRDHAELNKRTVSWSFARKLDPVTVPPAYLADVDSLRFYLVEIERHMRQHLYEPPTFPLSFGLQPAAVHETDHLLCFENLFVNQFLFQVQPRPLYLSRQAEAPPTNAEQAPLLFRTALPSIGSEFILP